METINTQPGGVDFIRTAVDGGTAAPEVMERFRAGQTDHAHGNQDTGLFGSDPAYWLGWTRADTERAEDGAYRDGWYAAIVEDFDAQPPDGPNEVREAWYQGFRGGTKHLNSQRLLEREVSA